MSVKLKAKSAILPYRFRKGKMQLMLVRNAGDTKWIIPKGNVEKPLAPLFSAAKEAYEEAGVIGKMIPVKLGTYKRNSVDIPLFLLEVSMTLRNYAELGLRKRRWVKKAFIKSYIFEEDVLQLVELAEKVISKNSYYFKFAIRSFSEDHNFNLTLNKKNSASVDLSRTDGQIDTINIIRSKRTMEFSIKSSLSFKSKVNIPKELLFELMEDNADRRIGFWTLKLEENKYSVYRMHNKELYSLSSDSFKYTINTIRKDCQNLLSKFNVVLTN